MLQNRSFVQAFPLRIFLLWFGFDPVDLSTGSSLLLLVSYYLFLALVHESELARNEPDSQVHHLPRAYDDGLASSAIRF